MTYLIAMSTRPEIIKMFPIIEEFKNRNIPFKTLCTGQHIDLEHQFKNLISKNQAFLAICLFRQKPVQI